jgi:hypothetical protein
MNRLIIAALSLPSPRHSGAAAPVTIISTSNEATAGAITRAIDGRPAARSRRSAHASSRQRSSPASINVAT